MPQKVRGVNLLEVQRRYLIECWNSGCHNPAELWREIAQHGFPRKMTTVRILPPRCGAIRRTCTACQCFG